MNIRGFVKFSLIDYPGKMSSVLFVGSCNFRCPYCHNPHLVFDPESQPPISTKQVFNFLETRRGKLDGIVITGGEPCLRDKFPSFADKIRSMGFLIKVDTNASLPDMVMKNHQKGRINALGIDYKAPLGKYNEIAVSKVPKLGERVQKTIKYAVDNDIPMDVRTTVHKKLLSVDDLKVMRQELDGLGVNNWSLQQFNPVEIIDESLLDVSSYTDAELIKIARSMGKTTHVRGLKGFFID